SGSAPYRRPAGFAITIELGAHAVPLSIRNSALRDEGGRAVEHCVIDAGRPHPNQASLLPEGASPGAWPGVLIIVPRDPLQPGTKYALDVAGDAGGRPYRIQTTFSTGAANVTNGVDGR